MKIMKKQCSCYYCGRRGPADTMKPIYMVNPYGKQRFKCIDVESCKLKQSERAEKKRALRGKKQPPSDMHDQSMYYSQCVNHK